MTVKAIHYKQNECFISRVKNVIFKYKKYMLILKYMWTSVAD